MEGGGGGVKPKQDDLDWKIYTYRGTNIDYNTLCEPTSSDYEEKEGDNFNGNRLINLKKLTTNKYFFVCQK